jgi:hypothetical protein
MPSWTCSNSNCAAARRTRAWVNEYYKVRGWYLGNLDGLIAQPNKRATEGFGAFDVYACTVSRCRKPVYDSDARAPCPRTCGRNLSWPEYRDHVGTGLFGKMKRKCDPVIAECANSGCGVHMDQLVLESHGRICDHRRVECDFGCRLTMTAGVLPQHQASCTHQPATCANSGCGVRVKQLELESHGRICDHRLVVCDFGCSATVKAGVLSQHKASCTHQPVTCSISGCGMRVKPLVLVRVLLHTQFTAQLSLPA